MITEELIRQVADDIKNAKAEVEKVRGEIDTIMKEFFKSPTNDVKVRVYEISKKEIDALQKYLLAQQHFENIRKQVGA